MKSLLFLICTLLVTSPCPADERDEKLQLSSIFSEFNELLGQFVVVKKLDNGGLETSFDYIKAKNSDKTEELIQKQKKKLKMFEIDRLTSKNLATAFWINAYNFFMISVVLKDGFKNEKLNIKSVKDFGSFFNPYRVFREEFHNIHRKHYSLDQIEKEILLGEEYKKKGWKDARIHFAVNCASVGCPSLLNKIYQEDTIDKTLNENIKSALKMPRHLKINQNTLYLTSLFKWYKKDFEENAGSVKDFIKKYVDEKTYSEIEKTSRTSYINYDWKLNSPKNF